MIVRIALSQRSILLLPETSFLFESMKKKGEKKMSNSALFVLVRKATPDKVLEEIRGTGGKVLKTSLSHDNEEKLNAAMAEAKA